MWDQIMKLLLFSKKLFFKACPHFWFFALMLDIMNFFEYEMLCN